MPRVHRKVKRFKRIDPDTLDVREQLFLKLGFIRQSFKTSHFADRDAWLEFYAEHPELFTKPPDQWRAG